LLVDVSAETTILEHGPTTATEDPDAALLRAHVAGDATAFPKLLASYRRPVYGYLWRCGLGDAAADDLFQEVFLRVHRAAHRYRPERPARVWIFTIVANLVRSHERKRKVRRAVLAFWPKAEPADVSAPSPERTAVARQDATWLAGALAGLPATWRQAVVLTRVEGMSQIEAGEVLGVPATTIRNWVHRGRLRLAEAAVAREGGHE
jgi:RNA polymerase sigma factor (sigma-70 family)